MRFANRLIESVWSADDIASIRIDFPRRSARGPRGVLRRAGALVDMIQSHLLQVMAFVTMEPPSSLDQLDLRDATSAVLRATHVWNDDPVASSAAPATRRATWASAHFSSYVDEPGVDPRAARDLAEMTVEGAPPAGRAFRSCCAPGRPSARATPR